MTDQPKGEWYPEIMYEEDSKIPFVPVPLDQVMPEILFMFESRETGEHEPGLDGEPMPIVELDLYQYANMNVLKNRLSVRDYDIIRDVLGLEPVSIAAQKGKEVTDKVKDTIKNS